MGYLPMQIKMFESKKKRLYYKVKMEDGIR